jgi:hypothetical protein
LTSQAKTKIPGQRPFKYSSVPNRRVGHNKHAGGKIPKKNKHADPNKAVQGGFFFSKLINVQGKY